ncbi:MAG: radical SAM protein [Candidatus Bathyarchaeia archaeon]
MKTSTNKCLFEISSDIPLVGNIAFGLIDRGTNVIQVRPISTCPLSCIFCSTNAGPKSKIRQTEYIVPIDYLVEEFRKIVAYKGEKRIEAHIDTVGDPTTYPDIVELVARLNQISGVDVVSMQTHGALLNEKILDRLSSAGLTRLNLSVDALEPNLAKKLADAKWYDIEKIVELMHYIVSSTKIDLLLAPVWIPSLNDTEIPKIIRLAINVGAGRRFPPLGIQKYERHKHGRKPKGVKAISWKKFYSQLKAWEHDFGVKLIITSGDFGVHRRQILPVPYKKFEKIKVKVVGPGWLKREKLAVTQKGDRSLTLVNAEEIPIGANVKARVVANKHNLLIAEPL